MEWVITSYSVIVIITVEGVDFIVDFIWAFMGVVTLIAELHNKLETPLRAMAATIDHNSSVNCHDSSSAVPAGSR